MRISALSSILLLGALAGAAHADRSSIPAVAVLGPAHGDRAAPSLSTGRLALTGPARPAPGRFETFLTAGDVTARVAPLGPEIERCYLDRAGASPRGGHLDLTLRIARDGSVLSLRAASSGLPAKTARKVEACIRAIVETVPFPARRNAAQLPLTLT
jgi:hypothetical protein